MALFCAPARAQNSGAQCESVRDGQAGAAFQAFMADAPDALLRACHYQTGAGSQTRYELRGPRHWQQGVCSFDAIIVPGATRDGPPQGRARDLLADLPRAHPVYMRRAGAVCPAQDDPSYTRTEAQYGVPYTDQFLWAMQAWGRLRIDPQAFAADFADAKGAAQAVEAMLLRNRDLPVWVVAMSAEAPSWRLVLHEARVTLVLEAPQDPAPPAGARYTVTLEPTLGGFSVIGAGMAR